MIYETLRALELEINSHLKYVTGSNEELLILSNLVDQSGQKSLEQDNIIYFSLLQIEEDKTINKSGGYSHNFKNGIPSMLNLYVIFISSYSGNQYREGLLLIDLILNYFQDNNVIKNTDIEGFPNNIDRLSFELQNLDFKEISNVFSAMGAKLAPHTIYKLRILPIFGSTNKKSIPSMKELNRSLNNNK